MKLSMVMTLNAVVAAVFGIAFVVLPDQSMALYGVEPGAVQAYLGQLLGSAYLTFAVLTWVGRKAADSDARRAIVLSLFIGFAIAFVVSLLGQMNAVVNSLGWLTVVLYLLFAVAYAVFAFSKPSAG